MKKRLAIGVPCVCLLFAASFARAQFGFGIIVFDPSVYAEAITEVTKLVAQYNQLVETYKMITNQYNEMLWIPCNEESATSRCDYHVDFRIPLSPPSAEADPAAGSQCRIGVQMGLRGF